MQLEERLVENEGNPAYGTIYQIKQYHILTGEQLAKIGVVQLNPDQKREIAVYQGRVIQELLDRDLTDVFSEGNTGDMNSKLLVSTLGSIVKSIFPNGVPRNPNEQQVVMLYELGAVYLYAIFRDRVTIHKTETLEGLDLRGKDEREVDTVGALKAYFDGNPGSEAVLVYGGMHDFKQYVNNLFNPRIESVKFPFDLQVFTHKKSRYSLRNLLDSAISSIRKK